MNTIANVLPQLQKALTQIRLLPQLIAFFALGLVPAWAQAGVLSGGLCRPYKQMVDNELFLMISVIAGAILVITWKLAPSGTALAKGVGLLAALVIGLNIENILQAATGVGIAC